MNVDDPDTEPWEWRAAEELMFNAQYDYPKTFRARRFLEDYRPLVLAAGAKKIEDVDFKPETKADSLTNLRDAFDLMRREGKQTDVLLMPVRKIEGEYIDTTALRAHSAFLSAAIPHVRQSRVGWREADSNEHSFPGTYFGARAVLGK